MTLRPDNVIAERNALRARVAELEQTTYCAYCTQQFTLDDDVAAKVTEHIYACDKHPMRDVEQQRDQLRKVLVQIEWAILKDDLSYCCPACNNWQKIGHTDDCALHAALTATEGEDTDDRTRNSIQST